MFETPYPKARRHIPEFHLRFRVLLHPACFLTKFSTMKDENVVVISMAWSGHSDDIVASLQSLDSQELLP
jgi:hypothetical protein